MTRRDEPRTGESRSSSSRRPALRRVGQDLVAFVVDHDGRLEVADVGRGAIAVGDVVLPLRRVDGLGVGAGLPQIDAAADAALVVEQVVLAHQALHAAVLGRRTLEQLGGLPGVDVGGKLEVHDGGDHAVPPRASVRSSRTPSSSTKPSTRKNSTHATPSRLDCVAVVTMPMASGAIHAVARPDRANRPKNSPAMPSGASRPIMVRLAACIGPMQKPRSSAKPMNTCSCSEPKRLRVADSSGADTKKNTPCLFRLTMPMVAMITPCTASCTVRLLPMRSSTHPPRKAPGMAKIVTMMPKMPMVTVSHPKIAAA